MQRVLDSRSQAHPLMTVTQQRAQIALLARGHPDRGKAILCEQCQQQSRIPPIMFLLPCLRLADLLGDGRRGIRSPSSSIISRNHCIEPVASIPTRIGPRKCGIKLPHGLALMFGGSSLPARRCRVSNIAIVCCRACRSHPIIHISASFDPSSVRFGHRTVYSGSSRGRLRYVIRVITSYLPYYRLPSKMGITRPSRPSRVMTYSEINGPR